MPQTTAAVTGVASQVFLKVAAGLFIDISGATQSVDAATATVMNSDTYTFDGANALILLGKLEPVDVTVNILYTETLTTEPFMLAQAAFAAKSEVQIKWQPRGVIVGANTIVTMEKGYITSIDFPAIDAASADPVMVSFTVRCPGITYTDVP